MTKTEEDIINEMYQKHCFMPVGSNMTWAKEFAKIYATECIKITLTKLIQDHSYYTSDESGTIKVIDTKDLSIESNIILIN